MVVLNLLLLYAYNMHIYRTRKESAAGMGVSA